MTFEEWADKNINTNQSAYTAAKAGWDASHAEAVEIIKDMREAMNNGLFWAEVPELRRRVAALLGE